jgi:diguanylate cyclase (GGDEF)-like protein
MGLEARNPLALVRAVFGREANTYAGSDIDLARRFARVLWPAGTAVMLVMVPFFPPTRQIGAWGWAVPAFASLTVCVSAILVRRRPERVTYNFLYVAGYWSLIVITAMQWLGGGRVAPYHELLLIQLIGTGLQHPPRRFVAFLVCVYAAAFAPLLYAGSLDAGEIPTELALWTGIGVFLLLLMRRIRAQRVAAHELARVDALTGLGNRRAFDEALDDALARARRNGTRVSVLVTDLDDFKDINDLHGHVAGDDCLRQAAATLRATVREGEGCYRWGGDEFAVLVPDAAEGDGAMLSARVQSAVMHSCRTPDGRPLTITCGHAEIGGESTPAGAVAAADAVLLSLKSREPVGSV